MRATIPLIALCAALAGCDRTQGPPTPQDDAAAGNSASAAGARRADELMAQTRQEALEARVATLENQMDTLKAEVDTRADLSAALAAPPAPVPPPAPPRLPYDPPSGGAPN
jgi:hypothetical protein